MTDDEQGHTRTISGARLLTSKVYGKRRERRSRERERGEMREIREGRPARSKEERYRSEIRGEEVNERLECVKGRER